MDIKNIFYGLILLSFYTSCAKNEKTPVQVRQKIIQSDLTNFKTFLPDGEHFYDVTVKDITLTPVKNAFEVTKEKYGVPEKVDGLKLKFSFDITNPHDRDMQMPFPEYFEITADEFKGLDDYIYSKQCHCYISNEKEITDQKGNPLSSFSKYTDVSIGRELLVDFKAKETRHIVINFEKPFPENIKTITIIGFNAHFRKEADYNALSEDEKEIYLADDNSNYALKIDIKTKKVIDIREQ